MRRLSSGICRCRYGMDIASTTITEETSLSMNAGMFSRSATVYTRRKMTAPSTTPTARLNTPPRPMTVLPMSSDASAIVTMPVPRLMSTAFCACAIRQPDSAVSEFATHSPTVVVNAGLMDDERTIMGLSPVARMARPSRVRRKSVSSMSANMTAAPETTSL